MFTNGFVQQSRSIVKRFSRTLRIGCNKDHEPPCKPREKTIPPTCTPKLGKEACTPPPPMNRSAWENGCCDMPCPDMMPRFDSIYYKRSDKAKRQYRQTWVECPAPVKKTKIRCYYDETQLPPIERRPRQQRPQTACNMMSKDCGLEKNLKCMKVVLPGCRSRRNHFHCLVELNPRKECPKRECAPYPSYSECRRDKAPGLKKRECGCVFVPERCELWKEMERWLWQTQRPC